MAMRQCSRDGLNASTDPPQWRELKSGTAIAAF
jgi:hypothetical protein